MIVPGDIKSFSSKPTMRLSLVVVILNVLVFAMIHLRYDIWPNSSVGEKLNDEKFKQSVYQMYLQTLDPMEHKGHETVDVMYGRALKDEKFWNRLPVFPFKGDHIAIEEVREVMGRFYSGYKKSPQFLFGLGSFDVSPWSWLTYQFVHGSFLHLLSNMIIIFMVLSYLERFVSFYWLALVYLFSGFSGGAFFLMMDTSGTMSVVGASASASGLLGFLLILRHSAVMPWFYMIAPIKNGFGKIYLPVFFILPVFLMSDFFSLMWETNGVVTNIAVSAHVGGALTGIAVGFLYLLFGLHHKNSELTEEDEALESSDLTTSA